MAISPIEQYIRQAAAARGIDPDIAVRVAKSEGGLQNPVRQSDVVKNGVREPSYGPFQLYMNGGLGSRALAAGIDPRDPGQWQRGVDYALNEAAQKGWGQWYGSKAVGIAPYQGISGAHPAGIGDPSPYAGMADGPKGQESYPGLGGGPTGLAGATGQHPLGGILAGIGIPQDAADEIAATLSGPDPGEKSPLQKMFSALAQTPEAPPVRFGPMGDARNTGDSLLKALNAPKIGDLLLQKRLG